MKKNSSNSKNSNYGGLIISIGSIIAINLLILVLMLTEFEDKREGYRVSFDTNGGSKIKEEVIESDNLIAVPEIPLKEGYEFAGWYYNEEPYDFSKPVTDDIKLEAKWIKIEKVSSIKLNYTDYQVYIGEIIKLVETVTPENATNKSVKWESNNPDVASVDTEGNVKALKTGEAIITVTTVDGGYVAKATITVKKSATNAQNNKAPTSYVVSFKDGDGKILVPTQILTKGNKVAKPTNPTKAGYTFIGWYNGNKEYKFTEKVKGDITLTAKWSKNKYTVTFVDYDGTVLQTKVLEYGDMPSCKTPTRENVEKYVYTFKGWSPKITTVKSDITYKATYQESIKTYEVSFKNEDGTKVFDSKQVEHGNIIQKPTNPTKEGYTFIGWYNGDKEYTFTEEVKDDITLTAKWSINKYTVTFKNYDGTVLETKVLEYGTTPTYTKDAPAREKDKTYTYTFKSWDKEITSVKEDTTYTATFDAKYIEYVIKFLDEDGTELSSKIYHYGDAVEEPQKPTKESTTQYKYIFAGWSSEVTRVEKDATYKATYMSVLNEYKITFKDEDGTTLVESQVVQYGGKVAKPTTPTKEGHTFKGWYNGKTEYTFTEQVKENITLTAKWSKNKYTVIFKNYDGTVLETKTSEYGTTPTYTKNTPTKPSDNTYSYVFIGWDKKITTVTEDIIYTAKFDTKYIEYIIKFLDEDGKELSKVAYHYGEKVAKPTNPTKVGHTFTGWYNSDKEYTFTEQVKADLTLTAKWSKNKYIVTFKNYDGTVLETKSVEYGTTPTYTKDTPTREKDKTYTYTFKSWDKEITSVKEDTTYTATFDAKYIEYIIKFVDEDGKELSSKKYHYGDTVEEPSAPTKEATAQCKYIFAGWSPKVVKVEESTTYTATYAEVENNYTIIFEDVDGTILAESQVLHYGDKVTKPTNPTKVGHTFTGWYNSDKEYTFTEQVKADLTLTAKWTKNKYTVTFKNYDGTVLETKSVEYGTTPTYTKNTPTKQSDNTHSYVFIGWDKQVTTVTQDTTYTATFDAKYIEYVVKFVDEDGKELNKVTYHYGDKVTKPTNPTKAGHTFKGWYNGKTEYTFTEQVKENITLTAKWTKNKYTVTFKNYDGTVLETKSVEYGTTPTYTKNTPTKPADNTYSYVFIGWDKQITTVTQDVTYTAKFDTKYIEYVVKFVDEEGKELSKEKYHYGDKVTKPTNPTKTGYTFKGWYNGKTEYTFTEQVKADLTLTAKWSKNKYTVTFKNYDGTVLETKSVEYGTTPTYTKNTPTKPADKTHSYVFVGWDKQLTTVKENVTYTATYKYLLDIDEILDEALLETTYNRFSTTKNKNTLTFKFTSYGSKNPPYDFIELFYDVVEIFHSLSSNKNYETFELYYKYEGDSKGETVDLKKCDLTDTSFSSWYGGGINDKLGEWLGYLASGEPSTAAVINANSDDLKGKTVTVTIKLSDGYATKDGKTTATYYLSFK